MNNYFKLKLPHNKFDKNSTKEIIILVNLN